MQNFAAQTRVQPRRPADRRQRLARILTAHLLAVWDTLSELNEGETPAVVNCLLHALTEVIGCQG
ncbi:MULTISPECIES: hypothetical protein [Thiorhodovibrio]|uniref:hypothetical protein n=1 Tax=Thiorhodovibrio TaxID=61593 RepID=UPI0019130DCD|nr:MULTISPECIES: hypothetical protein [Thiorhodovibrio]MBK5967770.1 hypothetical protein [Thiorhodovibrio winogradskyi]